MINVLMKKLLDDEDVEFLKKKYPQINFIVMQAHEYPSKEIMDSIEIYFGWMKKDVKQIMPNLKWIHIFSAGADHAISILRDISSPPRLTNNRGAYGIQLSEHSLAFVLAFNKNLEKAFIDTKNHVWDNDFKTAGDIYESKVGIIGLGDAGNHSAKLFKALGATVLANKLTKTEKPDYVDKIYYGEEGLDEMLPMCDYVIITLPGTEKTKNLFTRERMKKIKRGAIITNVGRGYIIDCDALADLLNSGHIRGAGLDVTDPEPLPEGHKLWTAKNILITPHIAGPSPGKSKRARAVFEENLDAYLQGKHMPTEVDFDKGY